MPNANSQAEITLYWGQKAKTLSTQTHIITGGNVLLNTAYLDVAGNRLNGNGSAVTDKTDTYTHISYFGGDNEYGEALGQAHSVVLIYSRNENFSPKPFALSNTMMSVTAQTYVPYIPDKPSPEYPSMIKSIGYENIFNKDDSALNMAIVHSDGLMKSSIYSLEPDVNKVSNETSFDKTDIDEIIKLPFDEAMEMFIQEFLKNNNKKGEK